MNLSRRFNILLRTAAFWAVLGLLALGIVIAGLGFLVTAVYLWLTTRFNHIDAAAITGAALVVLALLTLAVGAAVIKRTKPVQPSLAAEFSGTIGLAGRVIGLLVRRDPKKALILSVIAGALAEYVMSSKEERK